MTRRHTRTGMPRKHTRTGLAAVALLTAAALALTGCGGGSGDDAGGIAGVDESDNEPEPAPGESTEREDSTEPAEPEDEIDRPDVTLPDHMKNVFEPSDDEDPRVLAIITDAQFRISGIDAAIDQADPEHASLEFYAGGNALVDLIGYVGGFAENEVTWSGTARYYDWQVEPGETEDQATLQYCMDQTQAYDMDPETGDVQQREPQADVDFVLYQQRVERDEQGVWQAVTVSPEGGASRCVS